MRPDKALDSLALQYFPLPKDSDPFLIGERIPAGVDPQSLSRYGDSRWDLSLFIGPAAQGQSVNLMLFNEVRRESFRAATWALINMPVADILTERPGSNRVRRPSSGTMLVIVQSWRQFDRWLQTRGVDRLCDITERDLEDYAIAVAGQSALRTPPAKALYAISVLWGFAPYLTESDRIRQPPWEQHGMSEYLPPSYHSGENSTPPIHPTVMSALLIWAIRFVDDFADDIVEAWAERQRLVDCIPTETDPAATSRLADLVNHHRSSSTPLPGNYAGGKLRVSVNYLAAQANATPTQVMWMIRYRGADLPVAPATPLAMTIRGQLHGRPWRTHIDFHEVGVLMVRLSAACAIVLFYLSGMRPAEGMALRVGCCPDPDTSENPNAHYAIDGKFFKNARDADGVHVTDGLPRETPWTVIPPVVRAIRVLERMTNGPHLFPADPQWTQAGRGRRRADAGRPLSADGANGRFPVFINWVNEYARDNHLNSEYIPADPDGPICLNRFRRTIAWHIARLPGGRIALSTQYGHLRSVVGDGYSGRARSGLRRVLDIETARAMADYLDQLADRVDAGETVSGPAANRMLTAMQQARTRFGGMFLTPKQADALGRDPQLQVYDNPSAFLTCNYDPAKALCHPARTSSRNKNAPPALDRCNPACANIARTDSHMTALQHEIAQLGTEIGDPLTPSPLRERLKQRVNALTTISRNHRAQAKSHKENRDRHDER